MGIAGLVVATMAVLMGTVALADIGPSLTSRTRGLVTGHLLVALTGVVLLAVGAVVASAAVVGVSAAVLLGAAALGLAVYQRTSRPPLEDPPAGATARGRGPVSPTILLLHGGAALATVVVAVAAAIQLRGR